MVEVKEKIKAKFKNASYTLLIYSLPLSPRQHYVIVAKNLKRKKWGPVPLSKLPPPVKRRFTAVLRARGLL